MASSAPVAPQSTFRSCKLDLEGIVAKHKFGPYVEDREQSTWIKILNRRCSQKLGRERHSSETDRSRLRGGTVVQRLVRECRKVVGPAQQ